MTRVVLPSEIEAAEAAAQYVAAMLRQKPAATLAVSGGSTPRLMFAALVRCRLDWSNIHLFWVDERNVPPTHEDSNYRLADEHLIRLAGIPKANVHRVRAELGAHEAARLYEAEIRAFFGLTSGGLPAFDVIHQGIGPDAHTASLFPGEPLIEDRSGVAAAVYVEKLDQWRITLLPGVLLSALHTVVLAAGAAKKDALRAIFGGAHDPLAYPAQLLVQEGRSVAWFLDAAAAAV